MAHMRKNVLEKRHIKYLYTRTTVLTCEEAATHTPCECLNPRRHKPAGNHYNTLQLEHHIGKSNVVKIAAHHEFSKVCGLD